MHKKTETVIAALQERGRVRETPTGWTACCPAHDDQNPSLSVKEVEDRVLFNCFAGCTFGEIADALNLGSDAFFFDGRPTDTVKLKDAKRKSDAQELERIDRNLGISASFGEDILPAKVWEGMQRAQESAARAKLLPKGQTLTQIMETEYPEPVWIVPGLLPGGLTVLAGAPKSGKSFLALSLALALAHGGMALGKIQVEQCDVVYLALEDTGKRIQARVEQMGGLATDRLVCYFDWERGEEGISNLQAILDQQPETKLVIVDTLQRFRQPANGNRNVYSGDYEDLTPLKRIADDNDIAVLVIHHDRKAGADDWIDRISGSRGITGSADTIALLARTSGQADATLHVKGRDVEDQSLALKMDGHIGWRLMGDAREYDQSQARAEILTFMKETDGTVTPHEVAEALGKTSGSVRALMTKMVKSFVIRRADYGRYGLLDADELTVTQEVDL